MLTDDYRVRLEAFEGPLDLLLYLIRRDEIDLHDIPIARLTEQYMEFLKRVGSVDIDSAGEFLVMAATLMEIKSRLLMPSRARAGGAGNGVDAAREDDDPRAQLVQQLLAYKRYRDAADALERRQQEWSRRVPSARAALDDARVQQALDEMRDDVSVDDVTLVDLAQAFARILEVVNLDRLGEHQVTVDDTPQELHAQDILDRLARELGPEFTAAANDAAAGREAQGLPLQALFVGRTRREAIGLFLALLELVRRQRVGLRHAPTLNDDARGASGAQLLLFPRPPAPDSPDTPAPTPDPA